MKLVKLGNKKCYLMDDEDKGNLKKQLIQRWNIKFEKDYKFLTDTSKVPTSKIYLNTFGHNYYLYFTKLNGKNTGVMFDKWKDQAYFVRFRVEDILYYDTLFEGELIKQSDDNWLYNINDIIAHEGEDIRHNILDDRLSLIDNILNLQYIKDPVLEPCDLKKALFVDPENLDWLLTVYSKSILYRFNGINFKQQNYGENYLYILEKYSNKRKNQPNTNSTPISKDNPIIKPKKMEAVLAVKKTNKPDVYELYANDGEDMLIQIDYAYIKDVGHSQKITDLINTTIKEYDLKIEDNEYPEIPFLCQYSVDFNKWMPIKVSEEEVTIKSSL